VAPERLQQAGAIAAARGGAVEAVREIQRVLESRST